jgi:hypothetical protein
MPLLVMLYYELHGKKVTSFGCAVTIDYLKRYLSQGTRKALPFHKSSR